MLGSMQTETEMGRKFLESATMPDLCKVCFTNVCFLLFDTSFLDLHKNTNTFFTFSQVTYEINSILSN